ncbi:MAG: class I SAM-dependent methyltransferase [Woeseia sp.]|nr:cyclopropane-fatty-acyl-phospholipid synthase family protein [Woeseia sp.]NNE60361.1 class I SAM-dependent methyltransferase [Woeseia sp.]
MNELSLTSPRFLEGTPKPSGLDRLARRKVLKRLAGTKDGSLRLVEGKRECVFGDVTQDDALQAEVHVHDPRFYSDVAFAGAIGAGEAFIQGYWDSPDLTKVVRVLLRNRHVLENLNTGFARMTKPLQKVFHWLNKNSHKGSRRNISAHYDIGNDFFSLWLDESMMYSSAIFETPDMTLEDASTAKLERICQKLKLQPGDRVLEIGTGWGGFAIHAARRYGCHVTTTTISREQYELATKRVSDAGLEDRITLLLNDYRDLAGEYDKLVSIEMIEAVGHEYYDQFFDICSRLLRPDGLMCLQSITIADQRYDDARNSVDFIQRYIFPGGCLPSLTALSGSLTSASDMRIVHAEDIGPHYATTLGHWRERFIDKIDAVRHLGYSDDFLRMWKYYLGYCEGAFIERAIGNVQLLIAKPFNRHAPFID